MTYNKKAIITHPFFLGAVAFIVGVLLIVLLCKDVITIGGLGKALCS